MWREVEGEDGRRQDGRAAMAAHLGGVGVGGVGVRIGGAGGAEGHGARSKVNGGRRRAEEEAEAAAAGGGGSVSGGALEGVEEGGAKVGAVDEDGGLGDEVLGFLPQGDGAPADVEEEPAAVCYGGGRAGVDLIGRDWKREMRANQLVAFDSPFSHALPYVRWELLQRGPTTNSKSQGIRSD